MRERVKEGRQAERKEGRVSERLGGIAFCTYSISIQYSGIQTITKSVKLE